MVRADCFDGSDESVEACAGAACAAAQFACVTSHRCLPAAWRCDGARDCGRDDHSDETGCGQYLHKTFLRKRKPNGSSTLSWNTFP